MRASIIIVVVIGLAAGVWILREQTMTVHQPVPAESSLDVAIVSDTREAQDPAESLTRAHVEACVAESVPDANIVSFVDVAPVDDIDANAEPGRVHGYRFTLRPGADPPDRDQLHGCLEDLRIRHLQVRVEEMIMRGPDGIIQERDT